MLILEQQFLINVLRFKACIVLCLLTSIIETASGQDHEYIQYTSKDGLPTNYVYGVVEDDQGYIWAYTENGMSKFDGYTFTNYSTHNLVSSNDIVYSVKDTMNKIWLFPYDGYPSYLYQDSFHVVFNSTSTMTNYGPQDIQYSCGTNGRLIFDNDNMVMSKVGFIDKKILEAEKEAWTLESVQLLHRTKIFEDEKLYKSTFATISEDSIYYYFLKSPAISCLINNGYLLYFSESGMIYWKFGEINGAMYAGKFNGSLHACHTLLRNEKYLMTTDYSTIRLVDIKNESSKLIEIENIEISQNNNISISIMDSTFLINSEKGFWEYDFNGTCTDKMILEDLGEKYLLRRFYKDSKGNIWIGSREGGLFLIKKQNRRTEYLTSSFAKDKSFEQFVVTEQEDLIAITDNTGVYKITNDNVRNIVPPDKAKRFRSAVNTSHGLLLSSNFDGQVIKKKGEDYICSPFNKSFEIQNNTNFQSYDHFYNLRTMAYDSKNNCLHGAIMGNRSLIYCFNPESKIDLNLVNSDQSILYYNPVHEAIYNGYHSGINRLEGDETIPFLKEHKKLRNISALYSSNVHFWIGTETNGLYKYNYADSSLTKILDSPMIRCIRPDSDSTILIGSNSGVYVISTNNKRHSEIRYSINDGIAVNEIQDLYSDGVRYIYILNSEGIQKLDRLQNEKSNVNKKDLFISSFQVNKKEKSFENRLELDHDQNTIDIYYNFLSYASNKKIKYYTKLEPLQADWHSSSSRDINYLSLPPNEYTFCLKAKDIFGNEVSLDPIKIKIKKAYWQTSWFWIILGLAILISILAFFYKRELSTRLKIEDEKRITQRMAKLQLSALKAQMNPHFLFNALGSIQYFIQTNDVDAADNYLSRFARLMRKYLDSSKEKMITLKEEIELLTIYTDLEKMRFEDLFGVEINIENDISVSDIYLPTMIIQPFIENAINHGLNERRDRKGLLQIHFSILNNLIICSIKDNGIGRKNAAKNKWKNHTSRGMSLINEKIHTLKDLGLADIKITVTDLDPSNLIYTGTMIYIEINNLEDE